ncbi:Uncharacterized protein PECH_005675 [Penicillium ucsense]|uniref:Uncharacterized protein n=1 Tax=Penicillium ucsense TaxID=2839758 RepID=A0A8J8WAJ8_9EURO|nr:Uncharacterized protein PECM_004544 [Penicillium ucsense]KAF7736193.1 Uncharacterized protein PECH_005675 [Penicillium ucsense]
MAMQYFNQIKNRRRSSQISSSHNPVLTPEDEAFLTKVTSDPENQPEPVAQNESRPLEGPAGGSGTLVTDDKLHEATSAAAPAEELGKQLGEEEMLKDEQKIGVKKDTEPVKSNDAPAADKKKNRWNSMFWKKGTASDKGKEKQSTQNASEIDAVKPSSTANNATPTATEARQEQEDMTDILDRLNLAADNNRVFSLSDETQELLRKFKFVFKDLVNGVPTAYNDLEMLLTNGNRQLQETYTKLPTFMQKLIEKLPQKWTDALAPEMLAVASERAGRSGINMENVGKAASVAQKAGLNVPSLKELVSKPAAIAGMLRSIMEFLKARFPAVLGMNVLWSLALFLLLFVLWYCHKRGREVRLENERLVTEEEIRMLNEETSETPIRPSQTLLTVAPQGASAEEVREGVKKVEEAKAAAEKEDANAATEKEGASEGPSTASQPAAVPESAAASEPRPEPSESRTAAETSTSAAPRPAAVPTRTKSFLSMWSRTKSESSPSKVSPYPGT